MSAEPMPKAPSSMALRTSVCICSSSPALASPCRIPMTYWRMVAAPTNDPKLTLAPCCSMARSQASNACGPSKRGGAPAAARPRLSEADMVFSLAGAGVEPSPMISVVMPCATWLTTRPSPVRSAPADWPWISMKPGVTVRPRASMRSRAAGAGGRAGGGAGGAGGARAGGCGEAASVDALARGGAGEQAGGSDARDAIAADGDIAVEPGVAGAIDDAAVDDEEVVGGLGVKRQERHEQKESRPNLHGKTISRRVNGR